MDKIARAAGLSPEEFLAAIIKPGDTLAVGQTINEPVNGRAPIARWRCRTIARSASGSRAKPGSAVKKGIGFTRRSCTAPASLDRARCLASTVAVGATQGHRPRPDVEHGDRSGTNTVRRFTPTLIDAADIEIVRPDTAVVPDSGPTVASRTCMVVGRLVELPRSL